jgi:hypothetical protein
MTETGESELLSTRMSVCPTPDAAIFALEILEILEWVALSGRREQGKERARRIPAAGFNQYSLMNLVRTAK